METKLFEIFLKLNKALSKYMSKIMIISSIIFGISLLLMPILTIYQHWRFERYGWQIESIPRASDKVHLASGTDNRIWIALDDQVYVSDADKWDPELVMETSDIVWHFAIDNENRPWVTPKFGDLQVISGTKILSGNELLNLDVEGFSPFTSPLDPNFGPNNEIAIIRQNMVDSSVDIYTENTVEKINLSSDSSYLPHMVFGPEGKIFVAKGNSTTIYDGQNWETFEHEFLTGGTAVFDQVKDQWIAAERGCCNLTAFDYADTRYETIAIPYSSSEYEYTRINALSIDQQERLWVGFEDFSSPQNSTIGVRENDEWQFYSLYDVMDPRLDMYAPEAAMIIDSQNRLWTIAGSNIVRLDLQDTLPPSSSMPLGAYSKRLNYISLAISGITVGLSLCAMLWRNWTMRNTVSWSWQETRIMLYALLITGITLPIAFIAAWYSQVIPVLSILPRILHPPLLGVFQFILYGFILAIGNLKSKRKETFVVLLIIHFALVLLGFSLF